MVPRYPVLLSYCKSAECSCSSDTIVIFINTMQMHIIIDIIINKYNIIVICFTMVLHMYIMYDNKYIIILKV